MAGMEYAYSLGSNFGKDQDIVVDDKQRYLCLSIVDKLQFWRGYFDLHGITRKDHEEGQYVCKLKLPDIFLQVQFKEVFKMPYDFNSNDATITIQGINCLEFLYMLYDNVHSLSNVNAQYLQNFLYGWTHSCAFDIPKCRFIKTHRDAYTPSKAHISDSGYDLHLLTHIKTENGVQFYDTCIAIQPPIGYYFELVARSSLAKTGYILANSIGIIDASYTGSIKVALIKVCKDAPDLKLPARLVQLIPRQFLHLSMQETNNFNRTTRDDGGFGSSNHE